MKTKTLTLVVLLFALLISCSQEKQVEVKHERQSGLIVPSNYEAEDICCIYLPKDGLNVFDQPDGQKIGILTKNIESNTGTEAGYRVYFVDNNSKTETKIEIANFKEIGYESFSILYFERKDGFVRIINQSVDYWLNENEIKNKKFRVIDWQQFFMETSGQLLGFYANNPGIDLKSEPTKNSETKKLLEGELFEITPTNESSGNWTRVKVKKYKEHPCETELVERDNLEYEIEGWIEIISNDGKPNLWYYSRGC